jgi:hypothetical protein
MTNRDDTGRHILARSRGTSVRVRIRCVESGKVWESKKSWLRDMQEQGLSYHKCRRALMHGWELNDRFYEVIK